MGKKANIINNAITILVSVGLLAVLILVTGNVYAEPPMLMFLYTVIGAIVFALFNAFVHELGHLIAGKLNGFELISFTVWFFKWTKINGKIRFSFVKFGNEAGYTEMVAKNKENLNKKLKKLSLGGITASFMLMVLSVPLLFLAGVLPVFIYFFLCALLPVSAYYFFGNALPVENSGMPNDGAMYYILRKNTPIAQVITGISAIHSELLNGKSFAEIDRELYFNLPQLPEDNLYFITLLELRHNYYLDMGDTENLLKVNERLNDLIEYMPKSYIDVVKTDMLYVACVVEKNFEKADELMYDLDKYLNNSNTCTNVRVKMAYLLYVTGETASLNIFYKKGIKEAGRCQLKGVGVFESKLIDSIMLDFSHISNGSPEIAE